MELEQKIIIGTIVTLLVLLILMQNLANIRIKSKWKNFKPTHGFQYYRDALERISPSIVSFILDPYLDNDRYLAAEMMKLVVENYVEEKDGKYFVINNDFNHLSNSDKILLNSINNERYNADDYMKFRAEVKKEAIELGLIETKKEGKIGRVIKRIIFTAIALGMIWLAVYFYQNLGVNPRYELCTVGLMIATPIYLIGGLFYSGAYQAAMKEHGFIRTKKGNDLTEKALGLKAFMRDYTLLDERTRKEIRLWDYYMIYAIVFKINDNIHGAVNKEMINMWLGKMRIGVDCEDETNKKTYEWAGKIMGNFGKDKKI